MPDMPTAPNQPPFIWCFDLNNTITDWAVALCAMMCALRNDGYRVIVLTGQAADTITPEIIDAKLGELRKFGAQHCYDQLVVCAAPDGDVSDQKVAYMRSVGATGLVDNDKRNIKKAKKAGFLTMKVPTRGPIVHTVVG